MAHFTELDENNIVKQVIVVNNACLMDANGFENEQIGVDFCKSLAGVDTVWKQTSYNGSFRKRYAGVGFTYDAQRDVFIAPQPFPSWTLDADTTDWVPPVPYPDDDKPYLWDEATQSWVLIEEAQP